MQILKLVKSKRHIEFNLLKLLQNTNSPLKLRDLSANYKITKIYSETPSMLRMDKIKKSGIRYRLEFINTNLEPIRAPQDTPVPSIDSARLYLSYPASLST